MVGEEGEHSKPLVPVEEGMELGFTLCPQDDGQPTPQDINRYKCQKDGGGGLCGTT